MNDADDYTMGDLPAGGSGSRQSQLTKRQPELTLDAGLPANTDAEKTILGAILLDNDAFVDTNEKLEAKDFALDSHQRIFLRMGELIAARQTVDIVTLANELARHKEIEAIGGVAYLAGLTEGLPLRPVIDDYIRIVKDKSLARAIMIICSGIIARAADQSESALNIGMMLSGQIQQALISGVSSTMERTRDFFAREFPTASSLNEKHAKQQGIETGFAEFDRLTCGFQNGELIIVAARPSIGKTAFMWNLAEHIGINCESPVAIESLEMSKESLLRRGICSRARVPSLDARHGTIEQVPDMRDRFHQAYDEISKAPLFVNDETRSASRIATELRALRRREGIDIAFIDYLGLFQHEQTGRRWNQAVEVGLDVLTMKYLAKELGIPIVLLCQLSREVTKRTDKRPMLSDLRDSGNIEEHADMVVFLHREGYYEPKEEKLKHSGEIIIAKQRNGPTDTIESYWEGTFSRWSDPIDPRDLQQNFANW